MKLYIKKKQQQQQQQQKMIKKSACRLCFVVLRPVFILAKNFMFFCSSCSVAVCRCYLFN